MTEESKNKFIHLSTLRREDQKEVMKQIEKDGGCPFCPENLEKYHKAPILKKGKFWTLTDNQWPYENIKHQLLAIYNKHIEHISEIEAGAGDELFALFNEEAKKRNIPGGGVAIRFGSNPAYGNYGSSVLHLHAHLIEPDLEVLGETDAWRFKFGQPKNYKKA